MENRYNKNERVIARKKKGDNKSKITFVWLKAEQLQTCKPKKRKIEMNNTVRTSFRKLPSS